MIRSQLNSYSGSDPVWGFVALLGNERFTGEAAVGLDPRVRLFAVDGRVYFAEREGDAPVSTRLVNCGAVTTTQLEHGAVRIGDTTSLARLFQREPGIDRDAVELTIETATEALLESIADKPVGMPEVFPLRHHSSGIHHWLRSAQQPPPATVVSAAEVPSVVEPAAPAPTASVVDAEPIIDAEPEAVIEVDAPTAPVLHEWPLRPVVPQAAASPVVPEPFVDAEPLFVAPSEPVLQPDAHDHLWGSVSSHTPPLQPAPFTEPSPLFQEPIVLEALSAAPATPEAAAEREDPAEFVEPTPTPHANGFTMLPTLGSLSNHEATSSERLHETLAASEPEAIEPEVIEPEVIEPSGASTPEPPAMPTLGSLTSLTSQLHSDTSDPTSAAGTSASALGAKAVPVTPEYPTYEPGPATTDLPKLASGPISMDQLIASDAARGADAAGPWGGSTHNRAAVEIWEMIDGLDGPASGDEQLVTSGTEKRSRGWLRGRKG